MLGLGVGGVFQPVLTQGRVRVLLRCPPGLGCGGHIWKKWSKVVFDKNPGVVSSEEDEDGGSDDLAGLEGRGWGWGGLGAG